MPVPFLDLKMQYYEIQSEVHEAIERVLANTAFAGGKFVADFEKQFAEYCGCRNAVGVGSGTDALWLSLLALGIGRGDEVITVPNTFIATAEAISLCGARPVFIDIDEKTYTMDPQRLHDYLKIKKKDSTDMKRLKAIIPVHLFGQMADMDPIMKIAEEYGLFVVEDACQAHGAEYKGRLAGSIGDAGCFSFYPGKNLGAYGEAGAIVTDNDDLEKKAKMLRDHGQSKKYYHEMIGWNSRMDGLQGSILSAKLAHLNKWNESRRIKAAIYNNILSDFEEVIIPNEMKYAKHIYHIYSIRIQNRDAIIRELANRDIYCGIHYPIPIHLTEAYNFLGYVRDSFPVAEKCSEQYISLPMYPELKNEQIEEVCQEIKKIIDRDHFSFFNQIPSQSLPN